MPFLASLFLENMRKLMSARKVKLKVLLVGDTLFCWPWIPEVALHFLKTSKITHF